MASRNMTALLSMLALAGWQNRDSLGELLGTVTGQKPASSSSSIGANLGVGPQRQVLGGSAVCLVDCWAEGVVKGFRWNGRVAEQLYRKWTRRRRKLLGSDRPQQRD